MLKNNKNIIIKVDGKKYFCPVEITMDFLGGKWTAPILWYLIDNTFRYGELKRLMPNTSERMFIKELKSLESLGIVHRKSYPVVPPKVEYSLSDYGKTLIPLIKLISEWGYAHAKEYGTFLEENA